LGAVDTLVPLFCGYLEFYESPVDVARVRAFLCDRIANESVIFIARRDARALGFAHAYPILASLAQRRAWMLDDLFVSPDARGAGIATALLARVEQFARSTGAVRLSLVTAKTNARAQRVYERAGWRRDDVFVTYEREL